MSWFNKFLHKADHPMFNATEANRLLAELPQEDSLKALEDVTFWMESFKDASGIKLKNRISVAKLLDETGQLFYAELQQLYITHAHSEDVHKVRLRRISFAFQKLTAEIYISCIREFDSEQNKTDHIKEQIAIINARLLRAITKQMKLSLMHYNPIEQKAWDKLFQQFLFAEKEHFASSMVFAYAGQGYTSSRRELLRALALNISAPSGLSPELIQLTYRITELMTRFFELKKIPDPACQYYIDFSKPTAPEQFDDQLPITPSMRFFGAIKAVPQIEEIMFQNTRDANDQQIRFGIDFTQDGKLTVLKHLQTYWGEELPYRLKKRKETNAAIKISHGFNVICTLVPHINLDRVSNLSLKNAAKLLESTDRLSILSDKTDFQSENWPVQDVSENGIGGLLPKNAGAWVKVGALCSISDQYENQRWVGIFRRLRVTDQGSTSFGIEILSKKPISTWLRALSDGTETVAIWGADFSAYKDDYLHAILLPDSDDSYLNATMLVEVHSHMPSKMYEVILDDKSYNLKLNELLEAGDDYEHVSIQWLYDVASNVKQQNQ